MALANFGLDAELKAKQDAKYDVALENEVAEWIEAITGEHGVRGNFHESLKSGVVLCKLLNAIKPGTIKKINEGSMAFKQRENISNFVSATQTVGVPNSSVFGPDDLYDAKNIGSVVNCLFALGGAVQCTVPEFKGPHIGIADLSSAKHDVKRSSGIATQTGGLKGTMEKTVLDLSKDVVRVASLGVSSPRKPSASPVRSVHSESSRRPSASPRRGPVLSIPNVAVPSFLGGGGGNVAVPSFLGGGSGVQADAQGLDQDLKAKQDAKYDTGRELEVAEWIDSITGSAIKGNFVEGLRSGVVLCELINKIKPGTIVRINASNMPFKQRENISNFLVACQALGVRNANVFSPDDLFEEKNVGSVVNCLFALGGAVQKSCPGFSGPKLGIADTSSAKQDVRRSVGPATQTGGLASAMQKSELDTSNSVVKNTGGATSAGGMNVWNKGAQGVIEKSEVDTSKNIVRNTGGAITAGGLSALMQGAAGIMERTMIDKSKDVNRGVSRN